MSLAFGVRRSAGSRKRVSIFFLEDIASDSAAALGDGLRHSQCQFAGLRASFIKKMVDMKKKTRISSLV